MTGVRGKGLIAGLVIKDKPAGDIVTALRVKGILLCVAGPDVVRLLPPLVVGKEHIDEVIDALDEFLGT